MLTFRSLVYRGPPADVTLVQHSCSSCWSGTLSSSPMCPDETIDAGDIRALLGVSVSSRITTTKGSLADPECAVTSYGLRCRLARRRAVAPKGAATLGIESSNGSGVVPPRPGREVDPSLPRYLRIPVEARFGSPAPADHLSLKVLAAVAVGGPLHGPGITRRLPVRGVRRSCPQHGNPDHPNVCPHLCITGSHRRDRLLNLYRVPSLTRELPTQSPTLHTS